MSRVPAMRTLENALRRVGFVHVAGVDEVGRGCLAGPVVAAAVVLHPERHIPGVCDSKTVPAVERERLYDRIVRHAVAWAVAAADPSEIDRINIHHAAQRLNAHGGDPRYGSDRHKGYATADHLEAVARFGYSEVHRRSFRPPTLFDTMDESAATED